MRRIFLLTIIIIFIAMGAYGFGVIQNCFKPTEAISPCKVNIMVRTARWKELEKEINKTLKRFNGTAGVVINDLDLNWEIAINEDKVIPSASMVKIPIMMAYYCASRNGLVDLNARIRLTDKLKAPGSGTLKNAASGTDLSVEEMMILMITQSDNTAANILIDYLGMDKLNYYFSAMGLKNTNLSRKMMDFKSRKAGVENYTTARDIAFLLYKLYRNKFLDKAMSQRCLKILACQKVNDRIPKKLPEKVTVAHKTGLERGLCHDAGIVYTDKGNFLICVLVNHNDKTAAAAKSLISRISLLTYLYHNGE
ncbi:MAG: serine hydrolase [Candidatus Omnitrophica bacterium]|nr:serine hydrolase [Candidatus Omnitrophota bacterium]